MCLIVHDDFHFFSNNFRVFIFSSIERRIFSAGKTFLCFVVFLICIQPLLLCYFGKRFFDNFSFLCASASCTLNHYSLCGGNIAVYFLLCLLVVSISRLIWRNILIVKNQHLTFVKKDNLQTFSFTVRNPGIVNIILHLQGEPNIEMIRDSINRSVLRRATKSGQLMFPKLSAKLVSCWGFYAWKMCPE